jgi:hypothetical protein
LKQQEKTNIQEQLLTEEENRILDGDNGTMLKI